MPSMKLWSAIVVAASASRTAVKDHKYMPGYDDAQFGDGFEHGSRETEVTQSNAADFSIHQYLVRDDARDGPATNGEDTALEIRRQKALKAADHFNSEDTPDPDATLLQRKALHKQFPGDEQFGDGYEHGSRETEVTQSNAADFSIHQYLVRDDARDGPATNGEDTALEIRRQKALKAADHFNSEDTPDPDATLLQRKAFHKQFPGDEQFGDGYEHGSRETEVTQSNAADFSIHQYLVRDDARDGPATSGEDTAMEIRRQKALKAADHFNSEDTPDPDATLLQRKAFHKQFPGDEQFGDGYEHGSRETEVTQSNAADFSIHQYLVRDDARDGPATSGEDTAFEIRRQKALKAADHFNSEDTPDPDATLLQRQASRQKQ